MSEQSTPTSSSHPLLEDRARLEKIKNNMHMQIQLVLWRGRVSDRVERTLPGGESAFDVLQEALVALLETPSSAVKESWEALGVRIAQHKAKDALSRATRGRRSPNAEPGSPDDLSLVSLDERLDAPDDEVANDPERAFDRVQEQLVILRLARETLNDRERLIFYTGYYRTMTDKELGEQLGITGQAVGPQFRRIFRGLYAAALRDPLFPPLDESDGGEQT